MIKTLATTREQFWTVLGVITIVLCLVIKLPVTSSFWLDETITRWVINDSIVNTWERVVAHQGQSPFYFLLVWVVSRVLGFSELALRSVSLISVALTCLVLISIQKRFKQDTLVIGVTLITFLISDEVQRAALSARPYGLGLLCVALSFHQLIRFADGRSTVSAVGYLVSALALYYAHYLFIVVIGAHLLYAVVVRVPVKHIVVACIALGIGMAPGLVQLASLNKVASQLSFAPPMTLPRLLQGVAPFSLLTITSIALILGLIWSRSLSGTLAKAGEFLKSREVVFLVEGVLLPVVLFALSSLTGSSNLFVARYWVWQQLGLAILIGLMSRIFTESRARYVFSGVLVLGSVGRIFSQEWLIEDWRGVGERIRDSKRVALYSGLIETESRAMRDNVGLLTYLSSPLTAYGYQGEILLLGRDSSEEEIDSALEKSDFVVAMKMQDKVSPLAIKLGKLIATNSENGGVKRPGIVQIFQIVKPNPS